jgi:hypothetical protein
MGEASQATLWKVAHDKVVPHEITVALVAERLDAIAKLPPPGKRQPASAVVARLAKLTGKRTRE